MAFTLQTGRCIGSTYRGDIDTYRVHFPDALGAWVCVGGDVIRAAGINTDFGDAEVMAQVDDTEAKLIFGRTVTGLSFDGVYTAPATEPAEVRMA